MDLYEHQGKALFAAHGITLARSEVATSAAEARAAAERLGGRAVVKVQVQIGGRGKGGGIVLASSPDEAEASAARMLADGFKEMAVTRVLVEEPVDIAGEFYCAITLDRAAGTYLAMVSSEGGMDIEDVAHTRPEAIRRAHVDAIVGLRPYQVRYLTGHLPADARAGAAELLPKPAEVLVSEDATLVE